MPHPPEIEVCILAGGLSSRMGRDKSRIILSGRSMLDIIRGTANLLAPNPRVIRQDVVKRCGPIGGIATGLCTSERNAVLFMACDMPFVSIELLEALVSAFRKGGRPVFTVCEETVGFPLVLSNDTLSVVVDQIEAGSFALCDLARAIGAKQFPVSAEYDRELNNVNSPSDLLVARKRCGR